MIKCYKCKQKKNQQELKDIRIRHFHGLVGLCKEECKHPSKKQLIKDVVIRHQVTKHQTEF